MAHRERRVGRALATLDAHVHIAADRRPAELRAAGFALAMTLSAAEAELTLARHDPKVVWGVGCHPRRARAIAAFDAERFDELASSTPVIGEIGLDATSRVPHDLQLRPFRAALAVARDRGRVVSIHPHKASQAVLDELRRRPQPGAILHWWTGNADETRDAVRLGCAFSVHRAVARRLVWLGVPRANLLVESDLGYADPPREVPVAIARTERLLADRLGITAGEVREAGWSTLS
ncbi:MAG TPA: TatD family hydrolase, partial [Candidatus Limnocylindria bacterium]|nr:TatD family hydrolase [Candidatus Limnocylindria bacterium]